MLVVAALSVRREWCENVPARRDLVHALPVDHSADFPSLIFSSWFEERIRPLPVYGPAGNSELPSMVDAVHAFFNSRNDTCRYLAVVLVLQEEGGYELQPHNVEGDHPSGISYANIFRHTLLGSFVRLYQP
jgi:hypothetical protein